MNTNKQLFIDKTAPPNKNISIRICLSIVGIYILCVAWAWFMEDTPEGMSKLNTLSIEEAYNLSIASYWAMNPRIGELLFYFIDFAGGYKTVMLVIHPFFVLLAIFCVHKIATGIWPWTSEKQYASILVLIFAFFSIFSLVQTQWFLANFNWFYASTIALFFFCLNEKIFRGDFGIPISRLLPSITLVVFIGLSNENTSITSLILYIACGVYYRFFTKGKKKNKITFSYCIIACVFLCSVLAFYLSPARSVRSDAMHWDFTISNIVLNSVFNWKHWLWFSVHFWRHVAIIALFIIFSNNFKNSFSKRNCILLFSFLTLWGALLLAPFWGAPRSYTPLELILTIYTSKLLYENISSWSNAQKLFITAFSIIIICSAFVPQCYSLVKTYRNIQAVKKSAEPFHLSNQKIAIIDSSIFDFKPLTQEKYLPTRIFNGAARARNFVFYTDTTKNKSLNITKHNPIMNPWLSEKHHDAYLNRSLARRLGFNAIIFLKKQPEQKR